jgi:hypothetical protein
VVFVDSAFELLGAVPTRIRYSGDPLAAQDSVTDVPATATTLRLVGAVRPPLDGAGCDEPPPEVLGEGAVGDDDSFSEPPHAIDTAAVRAITKIPTRFIRAPSERARRRAPS